MNLIVWPRSPVVEPLTRTELPQLRAEWSVKKGIRFMDILYYVRDTTTHGTHIGYAVLSNGYLHGWKNVPGTTLSSTLIKRLRAQGTFPPHDRIIHFATTDALFYAVTTNAYHDGTLVRADHA